MGLSRLSPRIYLQRLIEIVPLWGIIIFFQIFLKNKYYVDYHAVMTLPFGIAVYAESIQFAFILLVKFVVSVSFIILLSSTTKVQDMLEGGVRLGLPADFALILGMMIRYLFVFGYIYRKVNESLATRCFNAFDRRLSWKYRIRQVGYTLGTLFIRAFLVIQLSHLWKGETAFLRSYEPASRVHRSARSEVAASR